MISRYDPADIHAIWSPHGELERLVQVARASAHVTGGEPLVRAVEAAVESGGVTVDAWRELERKYDHDIAAFVELVRRNLDGAAAELWHRGRTSSDLVEPALALGVDESLWLIHRATRELAGTLARLALEHRQTPVMGRTHGQYAEPTTIGRKFALFAVGLDSGNRLYGRAKLSGPVGTGLAERDSWVALNPLELHETPSTQIVPRWHLGRTIADLLPLTQVLSTLATEIRLASREPAAWLRERSPSEDARGSSAMPHKRNPIRSERAVGLLKRVRTDILAVIEAGAELWEERDISHSSVERTALVDALTATLFVVRDLTGVVSRLEVHPGAAAIPVQRATGVGAVEALIEYGLSYADAYAAVRELGPEQACIAYDVDGAGEPYDPELEPRLWRQVEQLSSAA